MLTPRIGNRAALRQMVWAADSDCYAQGEKFRLDRYLTWLEKMHPYRHTNLFVTAPDVVGNAEATLARSLPVLPLLRRMGWRVGFVGQDGLGLGDVPWSEFDTYFIGGSTEWKLSEASCRIAHEAIQRGKWVHMGRVNSYKRMVRASQEFGCHSTDGTYLAFGPAKNLPKLQKWLVDVNNLERVERRSA